MKTPNTIPGILIFIVLDLDYQASIPHILERCIEFELENQNATLRIAFIKLALRCPRQYFVTKPRLVANLPKSTVGMLRAALK